MDQASAWPICFLSGRWACLRIASLLARLPQLIDANRRRLLDGVDAPPLMQRRVLRFPWNGSLHGGAFSAPRYFSAGGLIAALDVLPCHLQSTKKSLPKRSLTTIAPWQNEPKQLRLNEKRKAPSAGAYSVGAYSEGLQAGLPTSDLAGQPLAWGPTLSQPLTSELANQILARALSAGAYAEGADNVGADLRLTCADLGLIWADLGLTWN